MKINNSNLNKLVNNKVVKSGGWYIFTDFFIKGMVFLSIPIFTRLLNPSDYGQQALFITWSTILCVIFGMNMNSSITKGKFDYKDDYSNYVSNVIFLSSIIFLGYFILFIIFKDFFSSIVGFDGYLYYLMIFYSYFLFIRASIIAKLRVQYKYKKVSLINLLISLTGLIISIVLITFVFKTDSYIGKIIGDTSLVIIFGFFFYYYLIKNLKKIKKHYLKYAMLFSAPLILHALSNVVNNQVDRIILEFYKGTVEVGLYSFAYSLGTAMFVIVHALDQAWSPWMYEQMEKNKILSIKQYAILYRNFIFIAFVIFLFLAPELVKVMAAKSYWDAIPVLPWIFLGFYFTFMYTLEVKIEFFHKRTFLISLGTLCSAIINIILNIIFIPHYGYMAAAITTTISYFFLFLFHYFVVTFILNKKIFELNFHFTSVLIALLAMLHYSVVEDYVLIRIISALIIILVVILISYRISKRSVS